MVLAQVTALAVAWREVLTARSSPLVRYAGEHMELVGGNGATRDAGGNPALPGVAEIAQAAWRKSSWSAMNGNCLEIAELRGGTVGVRDSKDGGAGPVLLFGPTAWRSFISDLKDAGRPL